MIFLQLLSWGTSIFCTYAILQRIWWYHLDNLLWKMYKEWECLDYPYHYKKIGRQVCALSLPYRLSTPVLYLPFVYKKRTVQLVSEQYSNKTWRLWKGRLIYQYLVLN